MVFIVAIPIGELIFYAALMLVFVIMPIYYIKSKRPVKSGLLGVFSGLSALFAVYFFGEHIGIYLPVNLFTVVMSLILGIPAVVVMVIVQFIIN